MRSADQGRSSMYLDSLRKSYQGLSWIRKVFLFAFLVLAIEVLWNPSGMFLRAVEKGLVYVLIPFVFARLHGRDLGLRFDSDVAVNTLGLCAIVLPFYVVAGSLPVMRSFYPVGDVPLELMPFVYHQFLQFFLALGTEVFYRGILCVWISDIGRKAVFVSPILYTVQHFGKPSPEVLASAPADIFFGWFDYSSDSIVPSVIAHWTGMILTDYFSLVDPLFPEKGLVLQEIVLTVASAF
jgi:hypothetical protein